ncbi:YaaC family protein [Geodermatophilus poikilotrophus]
MLLRGTRASPPGLAAGDAERRGIYNSALQQFEELAAAARSVGPASQPLALFYALEQAGQAILAARLEGRGKPHHGLRVSGYDKALHEVAIEPKGNGAFQAVAEALAVSGISGRATLGELWASLPEGGDEPLDDVEHPRALGLYPEDRPGPAATFLMTDRAVAWLFALPEEMRSVPSTEQVAAVSAYLSSYPTASGWESPIDGGIPGMDDPSAGFGIRLQWRLPKASGSAGERFEYLLTKVAPRYDRYDRGYLRPAVGGGEILHPLLTWWLILYALSMFARYQPGAWVKHLDVASSANAVRHESLLSLGLESVPRLVLEALTGSKQLDYR